MGNAALLLKAQGHVVSGSDTGIYPPMSDVLNDAGVPLYDGWSIRRLQEMDIDLVVIGNAMSRGNPELEWLLESQKIAFVSLPALLGQHVLKGRRNIVVCGTHGKTTTTTMGAHLLKALGVDPGWFIGGVPLGLESGAHSGDSDAPFIIEGDEYDSAFFDKRSKFIHYQPFILVINNIEFDHADIFRDLTDVQRTFQHVTRIVPRNGYILYNGDDANVKALLPVDWCTCVSVGFEQGNDLRIEAFKEGPEGASFSLNYKDGCNLVVTWPLFGAYNARNAAMAAMAASLAVSGEPLKGLIGAHFRNFKSVKRRQECRFKNERLAVFDDFAHHPSAIEQTLQSMRNRFPGWRLVACFEPRSHTACRKLMQDAYIVAFKNADACMLAPVHRADRYTDEERLDTAVMARELEASGVITSAFTDNEDLLDALQESVQSNGQSECIVFFSNGAFGGVIPRFIVAMSNTR